MKKHIFTITGAAVIASLVLLACKKKENDTIKPDYKQDATGTASNPQPNNVTVTGTSTVSNPATDNSSLFVGNQGWSNLSCISTNTLYLKSDNGETTVTLNFAVPPAVGTSTYNVASQAGLNTVSIMITKAPNQPSGAVWYGRSGVVSVQTTTSSVNAAITGTGVSCVQSTFNFPQVTLTGVFGCN
jgi:hypothetical protein